MTEGRSCPTCDRLLPERSATCPACESSPTGVMPSAATPQARPAAARAAGGFPSIEGYRFLRKLGEGGMGAVYLAEDMTLGRRVAIKVVSARLAQDGAARTRLLREARAMATAEHPHIVRVYSFGEHGGVVYIVMEYVDGDDLGERLRRLGRLPIEETLLVTRQIAEALEAAAEQGIVHRDIKPANVLLDARDHVRVADFGLAKPVASSAGETPLTQTGLIVGTPHYLSPEQARGEAVDFRSHIYPWASCSTRCWRGRLPSAARHRSRWSRST